MKKRSFSGVTFYEEGWDDHQSNYATISCSQCDWSVRFVRDLYYEKDALDKARAHAHNEHYLGSERQVREEAERQKKWERKWG